MDRSVVLFDVGGVFLIPHEEPVSRALTAAAIHHDPARVELAHYSGVRAIDDRPRETEDRRRYLAAYVEALDVSEADRAGAVDALAQVWSAPSIDLWRRLVPDSVESLRALATAPLKLGIVSNSDGNVENLLRAHRICQIGEGLGVPVLAIVDSYLVGIEKPDPGIFRHALEPLGARPDEAMFVGDSVRYDVSGARAAGIHPVHFDPHGLCGTPGDHDHARSLAELTAG